MTKFEKQPAVMLQARTPVIGELVLQCADNLITFDEMCQRVRDMGYKTAGLYEMVISLRPSNGR